MVDKTSIQKSPSERWVQLVYGYKACVVIGVNNRRLLTSNIQSFHFISLLPNGVHPKNLHIQSIKVRNLPAEII